MKVSGILYSFLALPRVSQCPPSPVASHHFGVDLDDRVLLHDVHRPPLVGLLGTVQEPQGTNVPFGVPLLTSVGLAISGTGGTKDRLGKRGNNKRVIGGMEQSLF